MLGEVLGLVRLDASYVVDVDRRDGEVRLDLEAALLPGHPGYRPPGAGEDHCYQGGVLIFPHVREAVVERSAESDDEDFGMIRRYRTGSGGVVIEADGGTLTVESGRAEFHLFPLPDWMLPGIRYYREDDVLVRQDGRRGPERWSSRDGRWSAYPGFHWAMAVGLGPGAAARFEPAAFALDELLDDVRAERALDEAARPTGASTEALDWVIATFERALAAGGPGAFRDDPAAGTVRRLVTDGWRWQAALSERVLAML